MLPFLFNKVPSQGIMQEENDVCNAPLKQQGNLPLAEEQYQPISLLRIPFYVKSQQGLRKILTPETIQKVTDREQCITLSLNKNQQKPFNINIFKKKLTRAMQLLTVKKLVNKKTGKIVKLIKKAQNIQTMYDYEQLGDFINSLGSQNLYGEKRYGIKQQDILNCITKFLTQKVHSNDESAKENQQNDNFLPLIQPLFYLKSYNLVPPSYDLLVNKLKPKPAEGSQVIARSINYEDDIPQVQIVEVPKFIAESELYKKIVSYLQKRPCWLKNSLYYTLYQDGMKNQFTVSDFKNVMKYVAFTYRNGPWKHTFCKLGFDPKKEFKSLIFQSVTIKIKQKEVQDYGNEVQEDVYDPTFQQHSNRFVRSYQLCDITNETVREIVQGKLISKQGQCTKQHGWLNITQHGKIMKTMKLKIQEQSKNQ